MWSVHVRHILFVNREFTCVILVMIIITFAYNYATCVYNCNFLSRMHILKQVSWGTGLWLKKKPVCDYTIIVTL